MRARRKWQSYPPAPTPAPQSLLVPVCRPLVTRPELDLPSAGKEVGGALDPQTDPTPELEGTGAHDWSTTLVSSDSASFLEKVVSLVIRENKKAGCVPQSSG